MIIKMKKATFDSLAIESISHACFEPMIPVYQSAMCQNNNQNPQDIRAEFYKSLSQGQRALFMFFSYYDHAVKSTEEFERISLYYLRAQIFVAVKKGLEYFHDDIMLSLLLETERSLSENAQEEISGLYKRFCEISPNTLTAIGNYIKNNPGDFVTLE